MLRTTSFDSWNEYSYDFCQTELISKQVVAVQCESKVFMVRRWAGPQRRPVGSGKDICRPPRRKSALSIPSNQGRQLFQRAMWDEGQGVAAVGPKFRAARGR